MRAVRNCLVAAIVMAMSITVVPVLSSAPAGALQNNTVPGNAAPSWQTNGIVRAIASANGVVYVGGEFTRVRPPGAAAGTSETTRNYFAAFNSSTGALITTFAPTVNGVVQAAALSPDKTRLYIGGDFTNVNGSTRNRVAGFNLATGALLPLNTNVNARVSGLTASATTLYIGGSFSMVAGQPRQRLAAVDSTSGALRTGFVANASGTVYSVALSAGADKLYVAGTYNDINGDSAAHSDSAVDATTGAVLPFPATAAVPVDSGSCISDGKDVETDGDSVYFSNEGTGGGCFDGTMAVNQSDGTLRWKSNCLGATLSIAVLNGLLYTGSHAHDCSADQSFDPDAFPEVGWAKGLARKLLARSIVDGKVSSWYPNTNAQAGGGLGPRVMATDGNQIFVGGDFTTVNNQPQQGFTRFSPSTGALAKPARPAAPVAVTKAGNKVSVYVQPPLDIDDTDLIVRLYRNGTTAPIASAPVHSLFWRQPIVAFEDNGLAAGAHPVYTADAIEANGTNFSPKSPASAAITVGSVPAYSASVNADNPTLFWRLGEPSGPVAGDSGGLLAGNVQGTVAYAQAGQAIGDSNTAMTTDGSSGFVTSSSSFPSPSTYSIETWVKTTSTSGGKIIGFGDRQGGLDFSGNPVQSSSYDKHIYMTNDGRLVFGVYVGFTDTLTSNSGYNDGQWHHLVGTQGPTGMAFYVDGVRVGRNGQTNNQSYTGYWRVGGDNLGGWPNQPSSNFFNGTIDDVAVYPSALTTSQVSAHYAASGRTPPPSIIPSDTYGASVYNSGPLSFWRLDETSGSTANDSADTGITGQYVGGVTQGQAGALGAQGFAAAFNGSTGNVASTNQTGQPLNYAAELWFKTNTNQGGKLIGFGNAQTGDSGNYDKHVYMQNDGKLTFGTYTGFFNTITTSNAYNDGQWHHLVANQSSSTGMSLYVDDVLRGTNGQIENQGYSGYWRVGGDNLNAWPSQPTSSRFNGTIDEVAIYASPLTPAQIDAHYVASGRSGPDIVAPSTAITSPANGATINTGPTTVNATATDLNGVTSVQLEVDGLVVDTDSSSPYSFTWNATAGPHSLRTLASDPTGNVGSSTPITVTAVVPDTTAPLTNITSPAEGAEVNGPTTVTADATDNVGVTSVALKVNGVVVDTDTSAPYSFNWNAAAVGSYTLQTVATDAAGNPGSSIIVNVSVPADTTAPLTSITSPAEGAEVFGPTAVTADATDAVGVTSVALKVDGVVVDTDTSAPYSFNWNATALGAHTLQTVATDAAGNPGSSVIVNVTVPQDTTPPGAPGGLATSNVGKQQLDLSWTAASDDRGVDHYVVARDGVPLAPTVTGLTFTDTGLTPGTQYSYSVVAVDAAGNSGPVAGPILVTTLPAVATLFSDTWTGANGAPWAAAWTSGVTSGTVDIQGNSGRLAFSDVANAFARAQLTGLAARTDSEALFSYQWSASTAAAYFNVTMRGSGGWQNGYRPRNGYVLAVNSNSGTVTLNKNVNGTLTAIRTIAGAQQVGTAKQWIRFRVSGSTIQVKMWRDAVSEPVAWTSTDTDTSVTAAGQLHLSLNRGGTNVGAKDIRFDDLTVTDTP